MLERIEEVLAQASAENPQITKEINTAEEDFELPQGRAGQRGWQLGKERDKGEAIVGNKQRDVGKEKAQGKPIRECSVDGRIAEEEEI